MKSLPRRIALHEVCALVGGRLERGNLDSGVARLAALDAADGSAISFLSSASYRGQASSSAAAAVVTSPALADSVAAGAALIVVEDPYRAYGALAREFARRLSPARVPGIAPSACVDPSALIGEGVSIAAGAVIGAGAVIDAGVSIGPGTVVEDGARIGADTRLAARVTVGHDCVIGSRGLIHSGTVIGSDGFGFARHEGRWEKIPQLGCVRIGDDVEIGANCAIDRGALEDTVIGNGCKLDNLIQVAHNVRIGEHTAIAACVGIAGSARIGSRCMIGGAAGILGHLEICDEVTISAMSLVTRSITRPGFYSGIFPLMDNADWERAAVLLRHLPDFRARLRRLESRLKES